MKKIYTILLTLCLTPAWAQKITCHITGTTTDNETKNVFLVKSGVDMRAVSDFVTIPVKDGRFAYDLVADELTSYELIPENQYYDGVLRSANVIAENQTVVVSLGTHNDKVAVKGDGKETKMMQECEETCSKAFEPILRELKMEQDSLQSVLKNVSKDMSDEERGAYIKDFFSEESKNPLAKTFKEITKKGERVFFDQRIATAKWLDKNPCFYGLLSIKTALSSGKAAKDPTLHYFIASYKNTYSKLYPGHPFHEEIKNMMASLDLVPGNKYIDFDVCGPDGRDVKLSSLYTGKIIYVDMWASWCGPCRKHAKALIPVYEKYKDKGFQVIGIAREQKAENMQKAISKDGYPWLNLLELNDQHDVWMKNGINNAGGGGFLITAEGTILAVYPEADETERILQERL